MRVILCDACGVRIFGGIFGSPMAGTDFCSLKCAGADPEDCQHEENISDAAAGRSTARLICKACGYDREEAVGETV